MIKRALSLSLIFLSTVVNAAELVDVNALHSPSYRVGTSDFPEVKSNYEVQINTTTAKKEENN